MALCGAFAILLVGCNQPAKSYVNDDTYLQGILRTNPHKQEALTWAQTKSSRQYVVGDCGDTQSSRRFIQTLYAHGAARVVAIDVDNSSNPGLSQCTTLIVELPKDGASRATILRIVNKVGAEGGYDQEMDVGQHFTMLHW